MKANRRTHALLVAGTAAVVGGITLNAGAQVSEPLQSWNLDSQFQSGETLNTATGNAPEVTSTEGSSDAIIDGFNPTTLTTGMALTFSGTILFPAIYTGGIQFRIGIMNTNGNNPATTDTGWLGYLAEMPNGTDGLGNIGARGDAQGSGAWLSGTGLVNLANQAGTAPGVNAPGTPATENFAVTIVYNGGSIPNGVTFTTTSSDGTYVLNNSGVDPATGDVATQANAVYDEVGFLFGSSAFSSIASGSPAQTAFSNLAVTLGQAPLTWNNANATATNDGATWDVSNNQNWNDGSAPLVYNNGAAVTFNDTNNGHYAVTLNGTVTPASVTVNNSSGNYTISGTGKIAGTGSLTKSGSGTLLLSTANSYSGGTTVNAGTLEVGATGALSDGPVAINGGLLQLGASTGLAKMTSLAIASNGNLDITNNHVIINYGSSPDPIASVQALLSTGYNGGAWNGVGGIISSVAAATPTYGVGYADSADAGNPANLSSGTLEIKYTLLGDANLDGVVNGIDFGILAANFNKGVTGWDKGDFNYDNVVNGIDFGQLAANFNKGASGASIGAPAYDDPAILAFAAANNLLADVPEPATAGLLLAAGLGMLGRRRRLSRNPESIE